MTDLARELRDEYPAVDVTTVVFSRDFAGVGCCVIPQERVLAVIGVLEEQREALKGAVVAANHAGSLLKAQDEKIAALVKALEEIRDCPLTDDESFQLSVCKQIAREALAKVSA